MNKKIGSKNEFLFVNSVLMGGALNPYKIRINRNIMVKL